LEGIVRRLIFLSARDELDVYFRSSSNVGDGVLGQFDTSLSILLDNVPTDVRLALLSYGDDAVVAACFDVVTPNDRRAHLTLVAADDSDAVFVALLDDVIHKTRSIIVNLNPHEIQLHIVLFDVCGHIVVGCDCTALAEGDPVLDDVGLRGPSLDVDAVCRARQDDVVGDLNHTLRL